MSYESDDFFRKILCHCYHIVERGYINGSINVVKELSVYKILSTKDNKELFSIMSREIPSICGPIPILTDLTFNGQHYDRWFNYDLPDARMLARKVLNAYSYQQTKKSMNKAFNNSIETTR